MVAFSLYFLMVYAQVLLLNATTANPVKALNDLLAHPGWAKYEVCEVVERWMDGEDRISMRHLLETVDKEPIVTEKNVDIKIRLTHQFMTCNFLDQLRRYYDYVRGIGPYCERMECPEESLECLEDYLQMIDQSVMPMKGALSILRQLSPLTIYNKDMSEILEDLKTYCKNKTLDVSELTKGTDISSSAVKAEAKAINRKMSKVDESLSILFDVFCWRNSFWDEEPIGISYGTFHAQNLTNVFIPGKAVYEIKKAAQREREKHLGFFNGSFGFKYNPLTTVVSLM